MAAGPAGLPGQEVPPGGGMVRHVMPVAILMIVQGGLELLMALLLLGLAGAVPVMFPEMPGDGGAARELGGAAPPVPFRVMMIATYAVMGAGGLIAGVLHVVAGIFGLRFRRRTLGIVALCAGLVSLTTCYCAPTAIGLAVYGIITYSNPQVRAAFALGDAGATAAEVRSRFGC
jgi:hypothetical protein